MPPAVDRVAPCTTNRARPFAFLHEFPDEQIVQSRPDVLTFTSEPWQRSVDLAGPIRLRVGATSCRRPGGSPPTGRRWLRRLAGSLQPRSPRRIRSPLHSFGRADRRAGPVLALHALPVQPQVRLGLSNETEMVPPGTIVKWATSWMLTVLPSEPVA